MTRDDEAGFDTTDPKHPDWHSTMAAAHDRRDKTKRVGELRPSPPAPRSGATRFVCRVDESAGLVDDTCDCEACE